MLEFVNRVEDLILDRVVSRPRAQHSPEDPLSIPHLLWMLDTMREAARCRESEWSQDKAMRWVGFIQAGLVTNELANLSEVKALSEVL